MALSRLAALRAAPHATRHALRCSVTAIATPRHASTQPPTPTNVGATPPVTPAVAPPVVSQATSSSSSRKSKKGSGPVGSFVSITLFLFGSTFLVTYYLDSRSAIHRWVAMPFLHTFLDPETAQKLAIDLLQSGVAPRDYTGDEESLESDLFGMPIVNPIGLAAGFDKQAEAIDGLFDLGFGLVEVGSVTPQPQPGNPQPRYFRLPSHSASINRFGFNSDGHAVVLDRLLTRVRDHLVAHPDLIPADFLPDPRSPLADPRVSQRDVAVQAAERIASDPDLVSRLLDAHGMPRSLRQGRLLGINLGKNKTSAEADASDFVKGVSTFGPLADYLVINVSSPNTPGLRDLQKRSALEALLRQVVEARDQLAARPVPTSDAKQQASQPNDGKTPRRVPLVVKLSPDLSAKELDDVASVILETRRKGGNSSSGIDGVIISNTTISRPILPSTLPPDSPEWATLQEAGGLSGPPLRPLARKALQSVVGRFRDAGLEVIAAGGVSCPEDVLQATLDDGATAVQCYTAFGWQGVGMVSRWKEELRDLLASRDRGERQAGDKEAAPAVAVGEPSGSKASTTWRTLARSTALSVAQREQARRKTDEEALRKGVKDELRDLKRQLGGKEEDENETVWWPEAKDEAYHSLLRNAREALGLPLPALPNPKDDVVPPTMVLSGSTSAAGGAATEDKGSSPERTVEVVGVLGEEYLQGPSKTGGEKKGKSSSSATTSWKEWAGVDRSRRV